MSSFKSPEVLIVGKIISVKDTSSNEKASFYLKVRFFEGQEWKLMSGKNKFQTFQSQCFQGIAPIEHPFNLEYVSLNVRGWPRLMIQVWRIDQYGRHNIYGYGTAAVPMASGQYNLDIPCWRPMGTWYDRFIGANSQLQYPDIVCSSSNKYGLRTFSGCVVLAEVNIVGRNFHLHGVTR